jgi:amidophosphoribosyltransferase
MLAQEAPVPVVRRDPKSGVAGSGESPKLLAAVVSVPDSANTAALGYQRECVRLGLKSALAATAVPLHLTAFCDWRVAGYDCSFELGLIRNHYVGRTFISPNQVLTPDLFFPSSFDLHKQPRLR